MIAYIIARRSPKCDLAGGAFVADQRNVVLVGGTGTGKSHLAIAIARALVPKSTSQMPHQRLRSIPDSLGSGP